MTGTVLTNNGLALITKLVAAKATLEFSRVAVGTGKVPQGMDPQAMISLNAYKMDAQISSYGVSPDQEDVAYIVLFHSGSSQTVFFISNNSTDT